MNPKNLSIADYSYDLPENRIAPYPNPERDSSKLLIYDQKTLSEDIFRNISYYLPEDSLIIFNNTRVIAARLLFIKPTGAKIEVFCLEPGPDEGDITHALAIRSAVTWKCFVGNVSSWSKDQILEKKIESSFGPLNLKAKMIAAKGDHFLIELSWHPNELSFAEVLHAAGQIPLPPYIKRKPNATDAERYQTVYANYSGSVAAPTAGLHFTNATLQQLEQKKIARDFVTLHVGAGTFKPVKSETMKDHLMHSEFIEINKTLVENILSNPNRKIIAVGTTSLRTLESIYWAGRKLLKDTNLSAGQLAIQQWEPYESEVSISATIAMNALIEWMKKTNTSRLIIKTSLLIVPGYEFKITDILITNFHQPRSTLLLLVAAFIGEKWESVYTYALANNFRFLSYGDACLFFRRGQVPLPLAVQV
ncbi:MAG: S-adenosylmethionine:tRNA ribosyltransferase-isomerase [Flavitalea sp.]